MNIYAKVIKKITNQMNPATYKKDYTPWPSITAQECKVGLASESQWT